MTKCVIPWCGEKAIGRQLCNRHFIRYNRKKELFTSEEKAIIHTLNVAMELLKECTHELDPVSISGLTDRVRVFLAENENVTFG